MPETAILDAKKVVSGEAVSEVPALTDDATKEALAEATVEAVHEPAAAAAAAAAEAVAAAEEVTTEVPASAPMTAVPMAVTAPMTASAMTAPAMTAPAMTAPAMTAPMAVMGPPITENVSVSVVTEAPQVVQTASDTVPAMPEGAGIQQQLSQQLTQQMTAPMSQALGHSIAAPLAPGMKEDEVIFARSGDSGDELPLIEVGEAMVAANEVFNRVKSEKIAEQALCSIRNDQAQYEGLAKEIVGKAIKQKERERANRASAAASRAKVLRYQTELESRLNRVEAERNAYRKEVQELRVGEGGRKLQPDESRQFAKLQDWIRKMEAANPQFVRSIIAQGEMDKLLGEEAEGEKLELEDGKDDEHPAKRRRL